MRGSAMMMNTVGRVLPAVALVAALLVTTVAAGGRDNSNGPPVDLGPAFAAQRANTDRLLKDPNIVGTAVTLTADGEPAVMVMARQAGSVVPASLDGVPVVLRVTGAITPRHHSPGHDGGPPGGNGGVDPKSRFDRPTPIGVSSGNVNSWEI